MIFHTVYAHFHRNNKNARITAMSTWKREIADLVGVPFAGVKQRLFLDDIG